MKLKLFFIISMLIWQMPSFGQGKEGFILDGVSYYVASRDAKEATVGGFDNSIYGDVVIPEYVSYTYRVWDSNSLSWVDGATYTYRVTSMAEHAFHNCRTIRSVSLPSSITRIPIMAFYGCEYVRSISIPSSVTSIGMEAFENCSNLESVVLPEGLSSIELGTFRGCHELRNIMIPNSVQTIKADAFRECRKLQSITIPEGITAIEYGTFADCEGLASITLPSSLKYIGNDAFERTGFTEFVIPEGVDSIGTDAFYNCRQLESVTLPKSLKAIGENAFADLRELTTITSYIEAPFDLSWELPIVWASDGMGMGWKTVIINIPPNTLNKYKMAKGWYYTSHNRTRATELVEFGSKDYTDAQHVVYTYSPDATMAYVKAGKTDSIVSPNADRDVVIPGTLVIDGKAYQVTSIGSYALSGPERYKETGEGQIVRLTLPETIEYVDNWAMGGCMETIVSLNPTPPAVKSQNPNPFTFSNQNQTTLRVPKGSGDSYRNADGWKKFDQIAEIGVNPLDNVSPIETETVIDPHAIYKENPIDNVINSVYYNLGRNDFGYSYIIIREPTDMTRITDNTPGSDDIWKYFRGLVMKVGKGDGSMTVRVKTIGNLQLATQIGNQSPVIASRTETDDVVVDYNITEDTYIYIYATASDNSQPASGSDNRVQIYSITVTPNITGISTVRESVHQPLHSYTLDGRALQSVPTKRGIYIIDGRKTVIK